MPQALDVRPLEHVASSGPGIRVGIEQRLERDVLRVADRLDRASSFDSEKPAHGMTIDHASTQRMR